MSERTKRERKAKLDKLAEYKRVREGGGRKYEVWCLHLALYAFLRYMLLGHRRRCSLR